MNLAPDGTAVATANKPLSLPKGTKLSEPIQMVKARPGAIPEGTGQKHIVTIIQDGDGFKTQSGLECRIDSVDAPETAKDFLSPPKPGQAFGEESKRSLESMIKNKEVNIRVIKQDTNEYRKGEKSSRFICQVEIEGNDVGLLQVQQGMGMVYKSARLLIDPRYTELVAAESRNRVNQTGIFSDPNVMNPADFRRSLKRK